MLLEDASLPVEEGWCVLPNGAGYVCNRNPMPGVTVEMVRWWYVWHGFEPIRYKLWYPADHYDVKIIKGMAQLCDESISMEERLYGVVHQVTEDVSGCCKGEPPIFNIHFRRPEELGFVVNNKVRNAAIIAGFPGPDDITSTGKPAVMCHVFRPVEGGVELRTRFWMGCGMRDGKLYCAMTPEHPMPEAVPRNLAYHSAKEYTNLAKILPVLYAEEKGKPMY